VELSFDDPLVAVFKTDDAARLPLAELALQGEGIAYLIKDGPRGTDTMGWALAVPPTNRPRVIQLMVTPDVAERARELLADLETAPTIVSSPVPDADALFGADSGSTAVIQIEDVSTGIAIGSVTENELQELTAHLEEDSPQQYFVDAQSIETLEHAHVNPALVDLLRHAVGDSDGVAIRWTVR
jgi:hypothetical protein